jgi:hypothetical protein
VALAIALHTTPLIAVAVLGYTRRMGARAAALRALALAAATALGVGLGVRADAPGLDVWLPWLEASIAGLMLHVVAHDLTARSE